MLILCERRSTKMNTSRLTVSIVIIVLVLVGGYFVYSSGPVVAAQGYSSLKVQPDRVSVSLTIETRNQTASGAQAQNSEITDRLVAELKALGIPESSVQLQNLNVYPEYDWTNGKRVDRGYIARREVVVITSDFEEVSSIVDAATTSNALVSYINFELSPERQNEYKAQALEQASKDARVKAQSIAQGQGRDVGRLVALTNNEFNYPGPIMYYAKTETASAGDSSLEAERAATNIAPRELEVSASVSAQYKLSMF